jgi:IPT/TIG domain
MKPLTVFRSIGKIAIVLILFITLCCEEHKFERKLLLVTKVYDGDKVIDPTFKGEIIDPGSSPIESHGFIWSESDNPDLTSPNVKNLGARTDKGIFSTVLQDLAQNTIYFVRAYATNAKGQTVYGRTYQYKTPQQETPLSAQEGGPGTLIVIVGDFKFGDIGEITVKFGDVEAKIVLANQTTIQVIVPVHDPGTIKISVTIKEATTFVPDDFTVIEPPVVESVSPKNGSAGSKMVVRGKNFIGTASYNLILFDSVPARVISATTTELVTFVPEGIPLGDVPISVKSGALKSLLPKQFKISSASQVTDYAPKTSTAGSRITITGKDISSQLEDTQVKFGTLAAAVTSVSDSTIAAIVPTQLNVGASVTITVTTSGKTFTLTPDFVVKAPGNGEVVVNTDISNPTVWAKVKGPGEVDYRITANVNVTAELTVAPGVIVEFDNGKALTISGNNAALIAKGTAGNVIVFTGRDKTKGSWDKISFNGTINSKNELDYVEVSYGGSTDYMLSSNYYYSAPTNLKITNSTFSFSKTSGVYIATNVTLGAFSNNTFASNGIATLRVPAGQVGVINSNNRFTGGNGRDAVEVIASTINSFDETVWKPFDDGSPYYISGSITVNSGMSVMPGAVLTFALNTALTISGASAYLTAIGNSTNKIIFTGADRTFKGSWNKIYFTSTTSIKNEFNQVEISNGGSDSNNPYNLQLNSSRIKISNTIISNSAGGGFYVDSGSGLNTFSFNSFSNNTIYPLYVFAQHIRDLDINSTFINNGFKKVYVVGSTLNDVNNEHTWKPFNDGTPYFMSGNVKILSGLSIQPGAVFNFNNGVGLQIGDGCCSLSSVAYITAKGLADKKIVFTGADQTIKGSWSTIKFTYLSNPKNEFDNVDISYASDGSISFDHALLKLTNSSVSNSSGVGLNLDNNSVLTSFANNTFSNNKTYPIVLPVHQVGKLDVTSTFTGNIFNTVNIYSSTINDAANVQVWPVLSNNTAYYVSGNIKILSGVTVQAGAIFTFNTGVGLQVGDGCCTISSAAYLSALGTTDKRIVFTGADQSFNGSWSNIKFTYLNSPKNELDNVDISNGFDGSVVLDHSVLKFTNSSISKSSGVGLSMDNTSAFTSFANNAFSKNGTYPMVLPVHQVGKLDAVSTFANNTFNKVNIYGSTINDPSNLQIWPALSNSTPYYVTGGITILSGVTIQPGALFTFNSGVGIQIGPGCCSNSPVAYLIAKGTSTNPITFTRDPGQGTNWNGINFSYTNNIKNEVEYMIASFAGDGVTVDHSVVSIKNSSISNCTGYGIRSSTGTLNSDVKTSNTFLNDTSGNTNF